MDVTFCCLEEQHQTCSFVFSKELLFCAGVQVPFPEMSWVNSSPVWTTSLLLPSIKDQVVLIQGLQKFLLHQKEFGKCSQPDCFFHYSSHCGMTGDHLAIELQWLKHAPNFPILQVSLLLNVSLIWHCDLDTRVGFFKYLAVTSRTSQTGLRQDCLLAYLRIGWYWGGVVQGSWHASGSQEHLVWVKSERHEIMHVWFWLLYWAGLCSSLRC